MRRSLVGLLLGLLVALPLGAQDKEEGRLEESAVVLGEILNIPEGIPQDLLDKAECVGIIPSVKKGAIGIGVSYGRGAFLCRSGEDFTGHWSAPAMYRLEGGSIGFQLGGTATDFVLLVMNPRGANAIIKSKVKLGADAAAAAGPKGRTAEASTDATMRAEILTYSRARGLFAGVSLAGSTLRPDNDSNRKVYGRRVEAREILREGKVSTLAAGKRLVDLLNQHSPRNLSD
ncbi:MAG: lipid-binding SYLF domain-containing protein [Candidatus Acidiferrales bacterium]